MTVTGHTEAAVPFDLGGRVRAMDYDPDTLGSDKTLSVPLGEGRHSFDYSYCLTAHKAQGDEWRSVLVIDQGACCRHSGGAVSLARRWRTATHGTDDL